jgi:hypothetical protein
MKKDVKEKSIDYLALKSRLQNAVCGGSKPVLKAVGFVLLGRAPSETFHARAS